LKFKFRTVFYMILKGYIFSILYVLACVLIALVLHKVGVEKKYTRKFVHIFVGFEWVILYHFFGPSIHFLAVCLLFTLLLAIDYKAKLLPAMSSDGDNAPGTVYYAVAMSILAFVSLFVKDMMLPFGVAVFCTSFGDGLAGVVGQAIRRCNPKIYNSKSLFGTVSNLVVCFVVPLVFGYIYGLELNILFCVFIALFATEIELFISKGLDNIVLTLSVALLTFGLAFYHQILNYIVPILLTPLIIAFCYSKKALTVGGIVLAAILDIVISLSLGNFGFVILLSFFAGSIVVDKIKKRSVKTGQSAEFDVEKKGSQRDAIQVFANGGVALALALVYIFLPLKVFVIAFVCSLAEAFADTVASGIGAFANGVYDIFRLKKCDKGLSGGMSILGTLSSLFASAVIAVVAFSFGQINIIEALIVTASGFFGGVFDSFLGSLFQVKYKCYECGIITEKEEHCGKVTEKYRGLRFVNNDVVNFSSTVFAAALGALLFIVIITTRQTGGLHKG